MTAALDERDRIRAAMERIFAGTPTRCNGALTIVALAQEADVPRNALTQRHTDLKTSSTNRYARKGDHQSWRQDFATPLQSSG